MAYIVARAPLVVNRSFPRAQTTQDQLGQFTLINTWKSGSQTFSFLKSFNQSLGYNFGIVAQNIAEMSLPEINVGISVQIRNSGARG